MITPQVGTTVQVPGQGRRPVMAGHVLRDSNGRYAGSTRGWGRGRTTHGGGFGGGKKGKQLSIAQAQRRALAIKAGKSIGTMAAVQVVGAGALLAAHKRGISPNKIAGAAFAGGVAAQGTRLAIRRARR
jgi:hypothetical protein